MVRATFQKSYLMRYLLLSGVCLFMAAWFGYDGFVGYPTKLKYARAYDELRQLDATKRIEQWKSIAAEKNWPNDVPTKTAEEIEADITGQYFWAGLNLLVGLPALFFYARSRGSWVELTDGKIVTSWGQTLHLADVTRLDKKKWERKGIAKATYNDGSIHRVFKFDDFKFEREPVGLMLRELEARLASEQITGGPRESELGNEA